MNIFIDDLSYKPGTKKDSKSAWEIILIILLSVVVAGLLVGIIYTRRKKSA